MSYKEEGNIFRSKKIWDCFDCDTNRKWIY